LKRNVIAIAAFIAACGSAAESRAPTRTAPSASAPATAASSAVAQPPVENAEPPLRWGTRPPKEGELFVALDGLCRYLTIFPADNAVLFGYGDPGHIGPDHMRTIARLTEAGIADMSKGLVAPFWGAVESASGRYPDALMLTEWGGGRTAPSNRIWSWDEPSGAWKIMLDRQHVDPDEAIGVSQPRLWRGGVLYVEDHQVRQDTPTSTTIRDWSVLRGARLPAGVTIPPIAPAGFNMHAFVVLDSGELVATGARDVGAQSRSVVRWTEGGAVKEQAIDDFTRFEPAGIVGSTAATVRLVSHGDALALVGGAWVKATLDDGPWKIDDGKLYRRDGGAWRIVQLPRPPFSIGAELHAERFAVVNGELVVSASYVERGRGWRDPIKRRVLLRSHRPTETLRCNEPNPEDFTVRSGDGFQSWPPAADASCATPFVVLAPRSKRAGAIAPYREIRAALGAHHELAGTQLVEVRSGDRSWIGAKAKDFAGATAIVDAVASKVPLRAEIVCADPETTVP